MARQRCTDVVVIGTGFKIVDAFEHIDIMGEHGQSLGKQFVEEGMRTYYGMTVAGFPSFFMRLGPKSDYELIRRA